MIKSNPTISYRKDYPRPGLVRSSWLNLDGSWAFLTDDSKLGESLEWQKHFPDAFQTIQVPFSYETAASGVHDETAHSCVWYQRPLILPENWESEKNGSSCILKDATTKPPSGSTVRKSVPTSEAILVFLLILQNF